MRVHAFGDDALGDLDAVGLVEALHRGHVGVDEVVEAAISRTEKVAGALNPIAYELYDRARTEARDPRPGAKDRPGSDLGGSVEDDTNTVGSNVIPGGPRGDPATGSEGSGRASGLTDPSGSRSLGNRSGPGSASGGGSTDGSGGPS